MSLAEISAMSSIDCNEVLAIKQPSVISAQKSFLEALGSWSSYLDIAIQYTKLYLDSKANRLAMRVCNQEEM